MNNLFGGFNPSKLKAGECRCSCQYSYMRTLHLVAFCYPKGGRDARLLIGDSRWCFKASLLLISKRAACLVPRPDGRVT
jgi:hypothetical protein